MKRGTNVDAWVNGVAAVIGAIALPFVMFVMFDMHADVLGVIGVAVLGAVLGVLFVRGGFLDFLP